MKGGGDIGDLQHGIDREQKLIDLEQVISDVHQVRLDGEQQLVDEAQRELDQVIVVSPRTLQNSEINLARRQSALSCRQDTNDRHQGQLDDGVVELLQRQGALDERQVKLDRDAARRCRAWVLRRDASDLRTAAGERRRSSSRVRSAVSARRPSGGRLDASHFAL